ncbi:MFS family permease [Symbiobacterium terraclitae]|uniref:MFS family permease n=1 Tax=Symbiobacterium terraclitae TaxID=557451 RepID=A0ABS4JP63_9FIRM|nr:MFS family permease [Symbiobacterium terraclitae]
MQRYLSLFRNRNFLLHWLAGATSNIGDFFNSLAVVKLLSQDPAHLGLYTSLIMASKMVPALVLGPLAGSVADRLPRKAVMVAADLVRAALVLGLVFAGHPAAVIGLVFAAAVAAAFFQPANSALLPSLVEQEQLVTAGSLNVMTQRLAMLLGNGLGAAVLMLVGPQGIFAINAATYLASALLLSGLRLPVAAPAGAAAQPGGTSPLARLAADLRETAAVVRASPQLRHLLIGLGIANLGDSGTNVLFVTFFTVTLGVATEQLGFVWAAFGGAAMLGSLAIGAVGHRVHWRHLFSFACVYFWFTATGAMLASSLIPSTAFLTLMGLGSGAINVGLQVAVAELVPDHIRGRVFGTWNTVSALIMVSGNLVAGVLADRVGPAVTMMGFALAYLAAGIYGHFNLRPREEAAAAEARAS